MQVLLQHLSQAEVLHRARQLSNTIPAGQLRTTRCVSQKFCRTIRFKLSVSEDTCRNRTFKLGRLAVGDGVCEGCRGHEAEDCGEGDELHVDERAKGLCSVGKRLVLSFTVAFS